MLYLYLYLILHFQLKECVCVNGVKCEEKNRAQSLIMRSYAIVTRFFFALFIILFFIFEQSQIHFIIDFHECRHHWLMQFWACFVLTPLALNNGWIIICLDQSNLCKVNLTTKYIFINRKHSLHLCSEYFLTNYGIFLRLNFIFQLSIFPQSVHLFNVYRFLVGW